MCTKEGPGLHKGCQGCTKDAKDCTKDAKDCTKDAKGVHKRGTKGGAVLRKLVVSLNLVVSLLEGLREGHYFVGACLAFWRGGGAVSGFDRGRVGVGL